MQKNTPPTAGSLLVRRQLLIGLLLVCFIGVLLSAIWYVTRLPYFQVNEVTVSGGITIDHDRILALTNEELSGAYLRLVPRRFGPLYPAESIVKRIESIDRIKQATVIRDRDNNLQVTFTEHVPVGLWCAEAEAVRCVFIDDAAYAFAAAPQLSGSALVRYLTQAPPEIGQYVIPVAQLEQTKLFVDRVRAELDLFIYAVEIIGDQDIEYLFSDGARLKVSQRIDPEISFANLKTVLQSQEFSDVSTSDIAYIDLRFGDKVFFKEVTHVQASSTASTSEESS